MRSLGQWWGCVMGKQSDDPDSGYSVRLSLDVRGKERPSIWPWVLVVLAVVLTGTPFFRYLVGVLL